MLKLGEFPLDIDSPDLPRRLEVMHMVATLFNHSTNPLAAQVPDELRHQTAFWFLHSAMSDLGLPDHDGLGDSQEFLDLYRGATSGAFSASKVVGAQLAADAKGNPADLVTEGDKRADEDACVDYDRYFPGIPRCAEESSPDERPVPGKKFITLDGIDGSLDGADKVLGRFATMAGLGEMDLRGQVRTLAAAILFLGVGDAYYSLRDHGAFKNGRRLEGVGADVGLAGNDLLINLQRFDEDVDPRVNEIWSAARSRKVHQSGIAIPRLPRIATPSSLDALKVIDPRHPIMALIHDNITKTKQCIWDLFPILAIMNEVPNAIVCDLDGNPVNPLDFESFMVVANERIRDQVLALLRARGNY